MDRRQVRALRCHGADGGGPYSGSGAGGGGPSQRCCSSRSGSPAPAARTLPVEPEAAPVQRLLLATTNTAKERELRRLVDGLALELATPRDLALSLEVPEEEATHLGNAQAKAVAFSRAAGMVSLASDGGLVLPALGDAWDSLRTGRFAGDVGDLAKARELLRRMRGQSGEQRRIFWHEALVVAEAGRVLASWEVEGSHGYLLEEVAPSRVVPGFWAAGIWFFPEVGKTYGELDEGERRQMDDHWTRLRPMVQEFLKGYVG
ncbi:MAG: hypothetical protein EXR55_02250 [Dehalococcoidia bacterium]|nr:hypothetical protein [Dehalococcoidia bacterium]